MSLPYVVRPLRRADFEAFLALRALAGPGFTSLAAPPDLLEERVALSERHFASTVEAPGEQRYLLGLEHTPTKQLVGLAGLKAEVGVSSPFFNFRLLKIAQACANPRRRFDLDVLIMVNEFAGASEVGALFVHPEHRGGAGRLLAQSRYMLIALAPQRFSQTVVSELRGRVDPEGKSPFWEALGRHFFKMEFMEADQLSSTSDSQFILDLMPKYPIYVDLLPEAARASIGAVHDQGAAALRMLHSEGFHYDKVIDIFDGGPLVSTSRDALRTVREARVLSYRAGAPKAPRRALIARLSVERFRCAPAQAGIENGEIVAPQSVGRALSIRTGDEVLAWVDAHAG